MIVRAVRGIRAVHRQAGACGPFGDITVDFEPSAAFSFANKASAADVPPEYVDFVERRFRAEMAGIAARAVLTGGRHHAVDSSDRGYAHVVRAAVEALRAELGLPRPAGQADVPELVRMRALLLTAMKGGPVASGWEETYATMLTRRLGTEDFAVFVLDGADGLAASGIGIIKESLPSPDNPLGLCGSLLGMATDPAARRQGHARRIVEALMTWFQASGVGRVDLNATAEGAGLYRSFGFAPPPFPELTWRAAPGR